MRESYEEWSAHYSAAMEMGHDEFGRDMFDLLFEKMEAAEIEVSFDASFWREDQVRIVAAAMAGWGYVDSVGPRLVGTPPRWMIYASRVIVMSSSATLRDDVAKVLTLFESQEAFEDDWDFVPLNGHPGTGPPASPS